MNSNFDNYSTCREANKTEAFITFCDVERSQQSLIIYVNENFDVYKKALVYSNTHSISE